MSYYDDNAGELFHRYLDVKSKEVHHCWSDKLPVQPGLACDIGAGSGRDAVWLASLGWDVIAVEPSRELRTRGEQYSLEQQQASGSVSWIADSLPELKRLRALDQRFQLILLNAVWMHLPPAQQERAMRIVSELLAPGGIVVISLRHGPDQAGRFHRVSADELIQHAHNRALIKQHDVRGVPDLTRQEIHWDYLLFQLPDDGTGSLPLLRHIIVNDNKTASYKLGLLRTLVRIAEGYPGMVTRRTDDRVEIPFGLVGLFWLKIYMPLVLTHNLIQTPKADHAKQRGYGWAKADHFYSLQDLSPYDLRVGATFYGDTARQVIGAIRDACVSIKKMPAHYTTYPGSDRSVFNCETKGLRHSTHSWQITRESLQKFGTFSIPIDLWQSFSQYGCWIEPAINNEWVRLMQSWNFQYEISIYDRALRWEQGLRSTTVPNQRIQLLQHRGETVSCVWTQKNLARQKYAVDHCFPWSRWLNNDLWNLMPATAAANNAKSDKLPSAALLQHSRRPIVDWWERAYAQDEMLAQQFFIEAEAALPLLDGDDRSLVAVFHAMEYQRTKLRSSQQLAEWHLKS